MFRSSICKHNTGTIDLMLDLYFTRFSILLSIELWPSSYNRDDTLVPLHNNLTASSALQVESKNINHVN
jgi:hypothetical protein